MQDLVKSFFACCLALAAWSLKLHSQGIINKNATCTRISATIQNVKPIIFLSVLAKWGCPELVHPLIWPWSRGQPRCLTEPAPAYLTPDLWLRPNLCSTSCPEIRAQGRGHASPLSLKGLQKLRGDRSTSDYRFRWWSIQYAHPCSSVYTHSHSVFLMQYNAWQSFCQGIMWDNY